MHIRTRPGTQLVSGVVFSRMSVVGALTGRRVYGSSSGGEGTCEARKASTAKPRRGPAEGASGREEGTMDSTSCPRRKARHEWQGQSIESMKKHVESTGMRTGSNRPSCPAVMDHAVFAAGPGRRGRMRWERSRGERRPRPKAPAGEAPQWRLPRQHEHLNRKGSK